MLPCIKNSIINIQVLVLTVSIGEMMGWGSVGGLTYFVFL